jgi:hypothetical protein
MLRVCKRNTSDPLVRAFLDNYGLNLLSIPRKNAMCGDLYIAEGSRVSTPGQIAQVLIPPPTLPEPVTGEPLTELTGVVSKQVSADVGLGLSEKLLAAFGAVGVVASFKQAYASKKASRIRFRFRDATRDYVDPLALGTALKNCRLDTTHPFVADGHTYFVVGGVVRTQSISIVAEDMRENSIDVDIGAMQLADAKARVDATRTNIGEITYTGPDKLAIGVELYELVDDREQQKLTLKLPKKVPRTLRGQSAPAVAPAFVGAPDGDIFITVT